MLTAVLLAAGLALGIHPAAVALAALASIEPRLVLVGAITWGIVAAIRRRRSRITADAEATYFRALSAELRAGASLRGAIGEALYRVPGLSLGPAVRYAEAGMPMSEIADAVETRFPENGRLAAAAFRLSDWSGARVADTFEGLAERAAASAELLLRTEWGAVESIADALMRCDGCLTGGALLSILEVAPRCSRFDSRAQVERLARAADEPELLQALDVAEREELELCHRIVDGAMAAISA